MGYNTNTAIEKMKNLVTYIETKSASKYEREETRMLKEIISLLDTKDVIFIEWGVDDVETRAEELHLQITKKQAQDVLERIDRIHDCNYGITWETIDACFDYVS